jgi:hypothetical protein
VVISRHWHSKRISPQGYTDSTAEDTVFFAAIARQRHSKLVFTAANQGATIEEALQMVFSLHPVPRLYDKDQQPVNLWLQIGSGSLWLTTLSPLLTAAT